MATGPIETHLHHSFNWENGAPGAREGPRGRSVNCGSEPSAQCVRLRSEINPSRTLSPSWKNREHGSPRFNTASGQLTTSPRSPTRGRKPCPANRSHALAHRMATTTHGSAATILSAPSRPGKPKPPPHHPSLFCSEAVWIKPANRWRKKVADERRPFETCMATVRAGGRIKHRQKDWLENR